MRATLLALLLLVAGAGNCVDVLPPAKRQPPKPVAGNWVGELYGVRFRLSITESGQPDEFFNALYLAGSGWLVYGGAPAESVEVALQGLNIGEPDYGISFEIRRPIGTGGVYGGYSAALQANGMLLGTFERTPSLEPSPSPWTGTWPVGTTSAPLGLTRQ